MRTDVKNKFLLCFRPAAMDGAIKSQGNKCSGDPIFSYIAVENKEKFMIPANLSSLSEKENSKISEGETPGRCRKRNARRVFSRILRAVRFETSLTKKVRNGKVRSESSLSAKSEEFSDINRRKSSEDDDREIGLTVSSNLITSSSSSSSSSFSSSCSSSTASTCVISESKNSKSLSDRKESFRSNDFEQKQSKRNLQDPKKTVTRSYSSSAGVFLLLISLSVMIFWGRVCAILFNSAWLYFVYRWNTGDDRPENENKLPEIDSREYKKKVIMEGLLERNHHRVQ